MIPSPPQLLEDTRADLSPNPSPTRGGEPEPRAREAHMEPIAALFALTLPFEGRVADRPGEVLPSTTSQTEMA